MGMIMTRVRVYSALARVALLISGCTGGSLSEAEQQSIGGGRGRSSAASAG